MADTTSQAASGGLGATIDFHQYPCIAEVNHLTSIDYINICNGSRYSVKASQFEIIKSLSPFVVLVVIAATALYMYIRKTRYLRNIKLATKPVPSVNKF